ncbi:NAD(P)H-binding protein [Gordonia liuliyuniae]|uniref:NAD(P)H-binding protein n=1 Tax=Gordonia liuliyuniae TaxID=2911517 RepID=A0ABS9ISJ1_9ACTN|nr:NAD(P)H-binding protein [Gordonia liuliyuniae]MCF8588527.1 NAD(P)H-binding protein [Gordonia liuliyuniae]
MTTYAVTGATGGLGGAAIAALIARGVSLSDIVAIARDEAKAAPLAESGVTVRIADYEQLETLVAALAGVDRLLLVSGSEVGRRTPQHRNVVDAAKTAGVGFIAYTSLLGADTSPLLLADEHRDTEAYLAESGVDHAILRNGWYSENYAASAAAAVEGGVFYGSAGTATVAPAARADFADAAAAAIIAPETGRVYELAGSRHLTYADIAAVFGEIAGTTVRYQDLPAADYKAALLAAGLPEEAAEIVSDSDAGAAAGALDSSSTELDDLRGGAAQTPFADVIRAASAI